MHCLFRVRLIGSCSETFFINTFLTNRKSVLVEPRCCRRSGDRLCIWCRGLELVQIKMVTQNICTCYTGDFVVYFTTDSRAFRISTMSLGCVLQQPPITRAPAAYHALARRPSSECVAPVPAINSRNSWSQISPELGYTIIGFEVTVRINLIRDSMCFGSVQLTPTNETY